MKKKISLALQGSGTHGAFTWGVLDSFLASDLFEIDAISATSSGGMNAAAMLQGFMENGTDGARDSLSAFWNKLSETNYVNPFIMPPIIDKKEEQYNLQNNVFYQAIAQLKDIFSPYQTNPQNHNSLKDLINEFFHIDTLKKANQFKLFLGATHVKSGKLKIFNTSQISMNVILASACMPTLFQAVEIENEFYWDGGFVGNPPIYPLIYDADATDIVVVKLNPQYRDKLPYTTHEIANRHQEITYNACLMREMRAINLITKLIDEGKIKDNTLKRLNMHVVQNEAFFQKLEMSSSFNTNKDFLYELYQEGFKTAQKWIEENYENIGKKSTYDLEKDNTDF